MLCIRVHYLWAPEATGKQEYYLSRRPHNYIESKERERPLHHQNNLIEIKDEFACLLQFYINTQFEKLHAPLKLGSLPLN